MTRLLPVPMPDTSGLGEATLLLLFAYAGFENTAAAAGEHQNPRRDVPFALILQIALVTLVYVLVQLVAISVWRTPPDSEAPLAEAMGLLTGPWGIAVLTAGALISSLCTHASTILAGPRFLYAIAHTGALPAFLTRVHPRFHPPYLAILVQVAIAVPLALTGSFAQLAALSVIARLATYLGTA